MHQIQLHLVLKRLHGNQVVQAWSDFEQPRWVVWSKQCSCWQARQFCQTFCQVPIDALEGVEALRASEGLKAVQWHGGFHCRMQHVKAAPLGQCPPEHQADVLQLHRTDLAHHEAAFPQNAWQVGLATSDRRGKCLHEIRVGLHTPGLSTKSSQEELFSWLQPNVKHTPDANSMLIL